MAKFRFKNKRSIIEKLKNIFLGVFTTSSESEDIRRKNDRDKTAAQISNIESFEVYNIVVNIVAEVILQQELAGIRERVNKTLVVSEKVFSLINKQVNDWHVKVVSLIDALKKRLKNFQKEHAQNFVAFLDDFKRLLEAYRRFGNTILNACNDNEFREKLCFLISLESVMRFYFLENAKSFENVHKSLPKRFVRSVVSSMINHVRDQSIREKVDLDLLTDTFYEMLRKAQKIRNGLAHVNPEDALTKKAKSAEDRYHYLLKQNFPEFKDYFSEIREHLMNFMSSYHEVITSWQSVFQHKAKYWKAFSSYLAKNQLNVANVDSICNAMSFFLNEYFADYCNLLRSHFLLSDDDFQACKSFYQSAKNAKNALTRGASKSNLFKKSLKKKLQDYQREQGEVEKRKDLDQDVILENNHDEELKPTTGGGRHVGLSLRS